MYKQQRILLYVLPFVFIFSGVSFPLGVMFYWVFSNLWTMGQQFIVIRNMPTPGSEAAKAREARLARKVQRQPVAGELGVMSSGSADDVARPVARVSTQRAQPMNKNRAKRTGERRA